MQEFGKPGTVGRALRVGNALDRVQILEHEINEIIQDEDAGA